MAAAASRFIGDEEEFSKKPHRKGSEAGSEEAIVSGHRVTVAPPNFADTTQISRQPTAKTLGAYLTAAAPASDDLVAAPASTHASAPAPSAAAAAAAPVAAAAAAVGVSRIRVALPAESESSEAMRVDVEPSALGHSCLDDELQPSRRNRTFRRTSTAKVKYTYEAQQQQTAVEKMLALTSNRGLSVLDRLDRVRRGHATRKSALADARQKRLTEKSRSTPTMSEGTRREDGTVPATDTISEASGPVHPRGGASEEKELGPFEVGCAKFEGFQFEEEESKVHFARRSSRKDTESFKLIFASALLVLVIGGLLGCIASCITLGEVLIWTGKMDAREDNMWPCGSNCTADDEPHLWAAFGTYASINISSIFVAACLVYLAPRAAASGLPPVKAYLNGVRVPGLLRLSTLVAKVVGITLVVSTGLPMGREGPMVHTGAMVAALVSRVTWGPMKSLVELRLPSRQRTWVGMGCAAGVAAAFNAPLGGILYAFEEVCSHWNAHLTWRAFVCVVVAALTTSAITTEAFSADGLVSTEKFVLGIDSSVRDSYEYIDFVYCAIIGIIGGLVGAMYTTIVLKMNYLRQRLYGTRRGLRVLDAVFWAFLSFFVYFWTPLLVDCKDCPEGGCEDSGSESYDPLRRLAWGEPARARRRLGGAGGGLEYSQHNCRENQYNELATLFLSPQEALLKHLLERETDNSDISMLAVGLCLAFYFVVAVLIFGIAVPAGNFIPGMTIGAALGRVAGEILKTTVGDGDADFDVGRYALMGAGAVLCGVTRMTLTLAAILVEITNDVTRCCR